MSDITWEVLNRVEQDALKFAVENKFVRGVSKSIRDFDEWTFACTNRLHGWGLLEPFITDSAPDPEYTLYKPTEAGRALLPAGEAVDTWASLTQFDLDQLGITREQAEQFDSQSVETTNTANTVATLQAELAAALARAEKAEERVERTCAALTSIFVECIYVSDHGGSATEAIESIVVKARDALK